MHNSSVVGTCNLLTDTCNTHCYWFSTKIKIFKANTSVEESVTNSNLVQLPWNLTGILESHLEFWNLTWNLGISFEILESHLNPVVISLYISVNVCKLARAITHTSFTTCETLYRVAVHCGLLSSRFRMRILWAHLYFIIIYLNYICNYII